MDKKEYWWVDIPNGALLFAKNEKIGYIIQDNENEDWWHYTGKFFGLGSDSFIASDLVEAKDYFLYIIRSEMDNQIKYYYQMMKLFM